MQLLFEIDRVDTPNNSKMCISHEPNNLLTKYYVSGGHLNNEECKPYRGDFTTLTFVPKPRKVTPAAVLDFEVKTFPFFGAYGFYVPKYGAAAKILVPLRAPASVYPAPAVVVTIDTGDITVTITENEYECHRIILYQGDVAQEFVTYDLVHTFEAAFTGSCTIQVVGHAQEIAVTSEAYEEAINI
jgi:hypothetical protein